MRCRSPMLYVPVLIFVPAVILLYITVELSLNDSKGNNVREALKDAVSRVKPTGRSFLEKLRQAGQYRDEDDDAAARIAASDDVDGLSAWMMKLKEKVDVVQRMAILPAESVAVAPEPPVGQGQGHEGQGRELGVVVATSRVAQEVVSSKVTFPPFVDDNVLGSGGGPVMMNASELNAEEKRLYDLGWERNSFNQYISDRISVRRSLPAAWNEDCQKMEFRTDLPQVSVILIFHNEAWSVLLRSVHSVLSRTPTSFLREVILVDDFSSFGYLKEPLDEYWRQTDRRVKVIHAKERVGLIRARLLGYDHATAPMLVFFDSHIECFPGWFEPLADRIVTNPNVTVFPSIEVIDPETFNVIANHHVTSLGIFRWRDLTFQWGDLTKEQVEQRKSLAEPIRSPTMPGGLFAISRDFFKLLGTYDPGLQYWGGENLEISFKAWMCYGMVELVPCSHVGHIFRRSNPIKWSTNIGLANVARVAHVWMDDYKNYFLERNHFKVGDYKDVSERKKLRESLHCRDFAWFIRNVKPIDRLPEHVQHVGELKQEWSVLCIDSLGPHSNTPRLFDCHGQGANQFWYISSDGEMFQDEKKVCDVNGKIVLSSNCHDKWNISQSQQLIHISSGQCLQGGIDRTEDQPGDRLVLILQKCEPGHRRQIWHTQDRPKDLIFPSFD